MHPLNAPKKILNAHEEPLEEEEVVFCCGAGNGFWFLNGFTYWGVAVNQTSL